MKHLKPFRVLLLLALLFGTAYAGTSRSFILWTGAATDTTAVAMADSSSVVGTEAYERLYLVLKPNRPCRIAIQVRTHGDTLYPSGAVALTDTTKMASWPWRQHVGAAGTLANQSDSTTWKEVTAPLGTTAGEDEYVVEFGDLDGTSNMKWWGPRAKMISLAKIDNGAWYWGPNTSIRYRVLMAGGVVTMRGHLMGVSF